MDDISQSAELDRVRSIAESAKMAADRVQRQVNALDSEIGRFERRGIQSFILIVFLIVVTAGGAWWFNSRIATQESSVQKLAGAQGTADGLNQRLDNVESTLKALPSQWNEVANRLEALDKKPASVTPESPSVSSKATEPAAPVKATEPVASSRPDNIRDSKAEPVAPRAAVTGRPQRTAPIVDEADRDRHGFLVATEQAKEVVPGVLLSIKQTDVERQEVNGWLYLQEQHRFVYLTNQRSMEPISVYNTRDKQSHDIVFTRVGKNDAVGYVLSPKTPISVSAAN